MKRNNINFYVLCLILVSLMFSLLTIYAFGQSKEKGINISARSAVLYLPDTEDFLYCKNADLPLPMASTTKIMTALVALENSSLTDEVAIDDSAIGIEGSSAYLRHGDVLTMEELLYALLLQSANDAATAIACHIGGSVEEFAHLMNNKACELGLCNTHFTNPHGLDNENHYTTARELAIISANALKNDTFKKIVSTYKKTFTSEERTRTYVNHNKLLRLYDGCIGVKTGFTKKSGRCLVGAAEKEGLTFITVTLDAPSDWKDHSAMLDFGFEKKKSVTLADINEIHYELPVINGKSDKITVKNENRLTAILDNDDKEIKQHIKLSRYVVAPIKKGEILGEVIYTLDGSPIGKVNLIAAESVGQVKTFWDKILSLFNKTE